MATTSPSKSTDGGAPALADRFPSAFTILFALIVVVAALTWIIPAGQYQRVPNEALAFYAILIPVKIAAGYDAVTGVAVILLGAGIDVSGSTSNRQAAARPRLRAGAGA